MKTIKLKLSGIVQGVFFRKFVKENADKLGVKGFVRNLDDGSLEIVAEGIDKKVDQLAEICKKGPQHSKIENVIVEELKYQGFDSFRVLSL